MTSKYEHNINGSSKQQSSRKAYISPKTSSTQDASTLAQLCPCACGLLVRDETESEVSINKSLSTLKDKLIKTKLEELGFYLDSKEVVRSRMHNDIQVRKTKMQKLKKDLSIKHWKEETVQLQVQIEELRESIQFFEQENEYIRRLTEKCRCLSDKRRDLQQLLLPINITHSGLTTTIQYLQAKYHNEHGIIASLTEIFQGSTKNIQQVATKLLAPFIEYWHQNPTDSIVTKRVPSASSTRILLKPSSSIFNVY
ncbi:uncharacterized protein LOC105422217 [Pogonomyrmex barbatus]|uniref:Uncharacterized protein LOC105422217 n=1 Tax=Pogonomyrmex barbatus TaxID=144034 RepID=A0A6I9WDH0_9HYME|nr:uncharacterized protein LOC105422217 [Pogonomyrmex barbatus]